MRRCNLGRDHFRSTPEVSQDRETGAKRRLMVIIVVLVFERFSSLIGFIGFAGSRLPARDIEEAASSPYSSRPFLKSGAKKTCKLELSFGEVMARAALSSFARRRGRRRRWPALRRPLHPRRRRRPDLPPVRRPGWKSSLNTLGSANSSYKGRAALSTVGNLRTWIDPPPRPPHMDGLTSDRRPKVPPASTVSGIAPPCLLVQLYGALTLKE